MAFITCFAFSMGPIAWILAAEVFPLRLRGRGVAAATLASGTSNFIVSLTFLSLIKAAGNSLTFPDLRRLLRRRAAVRALRDSRDEGTGIGEHQRSAAGP